MQIERFIAPGLAHVSYESLRLRYFSTSQEARTTD
jgi:hypothetical protein